MNKLDSLDLALAIAVIALGASGTYLLLPHRHGAAKAHRVHVAGGLLTGLSILIFAFRFWTAPGPIGSYLLSDLFFYGFGISAVACGVLTITSRDPVYSALWFAAVVLSTAGLFLLAGAQFLAAGTVIVYAGAIIVTFLFVIMLAQSGGQASYDRMSRSPARATFTCFLLFWGLLYALVEFRHPLPTAEAPGIEAVTRNRLVRPSERLAGLRKGDPALMVYQAAARPTSRLPAPSTRPGVPSPHVAGLGGTLYTDHLLSVEVAGALLFVALIGALAIAAPKPPVRPGDPRNVSPILTKEDGDARA